LHSEPRHEYTQFTVQEIRRETPVFEVVDTRWPRV